MFFTKREINDKNDKNFQSNLTLYEPNQNTKIGLRTLKVNFLYIKYNSIDNVD